MFDKDGLLTVGDHPLTLDELKTSILVKGRPNLLEPWDYDWRLHLVNNLAILVKQLWQVGIDSIYIDGSFVEEKAHPNDIDGYFECSRDDITTGRLTKELNRLDSFSGVDLELE